MNISCARNPIPQSTNSCVIRRQKEGYLFYNSRTDELHLMPSTGFLVYQLCDGLRTTSEIEQWLAEAIPSNRQAIREPVQQFLEALVARGILEMTDDT